MKADKIDWRDARTLAGEMLKKYPGYLDKDEVKKLVEVTGGDTSDKSTKYVSDLWDRVHYER